LKGRSCKAFVKLCESREEEKQDVRNDPKLADVFRWVKVMKVLVKVNLKV
jgi:hypothetical protein